MKDEKKVWMMIKGEHPMKNANDANDANNVKNANNVNPTRHDEWRRSVVNICEQRRTSDEEC